MKFRKFLKQWLGYSRRERTGSMVLLIILMAVLAIRTIRTSNTGVNDQVPPQLAKYSGKELSEYTLESADEEFDESYWHRSEDQRQQGKSDAHQHVEKVENPSSGSLTPARMPHRSDRTGIPPLTVDQIDINRADSAELEALPGIGPVLSVRIIKYRYLIGYFYGIDQLEDVYGIDKDVIEMNRTRIKCDSSMVRKININTAAYSDLLRHPYIKRNHVEAIINYRRLYGSFNDISELRHNRIFTNDEITRLRPYLEL